MKKTVLAAAAIGLMTPSMPVAARNDGEKNTSASTRKEPSEAEVMAMMQAMFPVEPLTAEQRDRLPQAQAVIAKLMPPGAMQQVAGGMFDKMLNPMVAMATKADGSVVARELAIEDENFAIDESAAARVAEILDPVREERVRLVTEATQRAMSGAMIAMEPAMRKGMAEAYAATFTKPELTAIDAFFSTVEGASYARKSYALASDPRIMAAAMEGLPAMMGQMKAMEADVKSADAKLPPRRAYADLSAAERAELAKLTGLTQDGIRQGMAKAADKRVGDPGDDAEGAE